MLVKGQERELVAVGGPPGRRVARKHLEEPSQSQKSRRGVLVKQKAVHLLLVNPIRHAIERRRAPVERDPNGRRVFVLDGRLLEYVEVVGVHVGDMVVDGGEGCNGGMGREAGLAKGGGLRGVDRVDVKVRVRGVTPELGLKGYNEQGTAREDVLGLTFSLSASRRMNLRSELTWKDQ